MESYPLPRINDTLTGSKWFSSLDLKSGYWKMEVDPTDKHKTGFSAGNTLYEIKVLRFVFCYAPATVERLMEFVLTGLTWKACLVYLADVRVLGKIFQNHLESFGEVFSWLKFKLVKLNPKKVTSFRRVVSGPNKNWNCQKLAST